MRYEFGAYTGSETGVIRIAPSLEQLCTGGLGAGVPVHVVKALTPQDHYLLEQMANFNRERIPERQPHAKGGGAFGIFQVSKGPSGPTDSECSSLATGIPPSVVVAGRLRSKRSPLSCHG